MKKRTRRPPLTAEMREYVAENMKERIYATITLLAVIVSLWHTAEHHTVGGALASILGTVAALWLATLVAAQMSHRTVHGKNMSKREGARLMFASSGLFLPAIAPTLLLFFSDTGIIGMKTALTASVIVLLLSLFGASFAAARKIYVNPWQMLLVSILELAIGVGVVALKLAVGE